MKEKGMSITGTSNGITQFTTKNGVVVHQVLVLVPNAQGLLQVNLKETPNPSDFPVGADLDLKVLPMFYNGRLSGIQKI